MALMGSITPAPSVRADATFVVREAHAASVYILIIRRKPHRKRKGDHRQRACSATNEIDDATELNPSL